MQDNVTPEEKLLNLIKKNEKPPIDAKQEKPKNKVTAVESKPVVKFSGTLPRKTGEKKTGYFSILNKFLTVVFLCAIICMVFVYMYTLKTKNKIQERAEAGGIGAVSESTPKTNPPLSYYTDILSKRQMFKIYETQKQKPTGPPKPKVTLQQLLGGYTFVGIIFGDVPQAIVEERRTSQSFYLTAGQFLGEIKIEKIESGKVTVSYEGETMDIRI